ncbi:fimbria/pilus outer membrane usher protein [Serratia ureilytica]
MNNTWQVGSGVTRSGKPTASGYYTYTASFGTLNANASYQQGSYSSIGGGTFRGGLTATRTASPHQNAGNGGSRMMLDTNGVAGADQQRPRFTATASDWR